MRKFEFVMRKVYKQNGIRIFLMFFAFMLPTHAWRVFVELLVFSGLLPRDIAHGDEELTLQFPLLRWEIFLYEFLSGAVPLFVSGMFVLALKNGNWWYFEDLGKSFLSMPYVYSLCVLSAKYLKSHFIFPLVFIVLDSVFCKTAWFYVSPICQGSPVSAVVSLGVFTLTALLYSETRMFKGVEE